MCLLWTFSWNHCLDVLSSIGYFKEIPIRDERQVFSYFESHSVKQRGKWGGEWLPMVQHKSRFRESTIKSQIIFHLPSLTKYFSSNIWQLSFLFFCHDWEGEHTNRRIYLIWALHLITPHTPNLGKSKKEEVWNPNSWTNSVSWPTIRATKSKKMRWSFCFLRMFCHCKDWIGFDMKSVIWEMKIGYWGCDRNKLDQMLSEHFMVYFFPVFSP